MTPADDRGKYFRAIEEEFSRRRSAPMLLSPRDWSLIGTWHEAGIPIWIVLQGIANVFDAFERRAPEPRRINSLSYCRQEIETLYEIYRTVRATEAGAPGPGEPPERIVARHMGRLTRRLRETMSIASEAGHDALVAALATASAELKRLRREARAGDVALHGLEDRLRRIDEAVLAGARASLTDEETRQLRDDTDGRLAGPKGRMTPEGYASTRSAAEGTLLRRLRALPRLTLFD